MSIRLGAWIPNRGAWPLDPGIGAMGRMAEEAGFDVATVSDHVVMPTVTQSFYPFSRTGEPNWDPRDPWFDAIVTLSVLAEATSRIEIGVGVLVLPMRQPIVVAKQLASIDSISGGRLILGVGAGWLEEEFRALNVPFDQRGSRTDEWIALLRGQWTGEPPAFEGEHYILPDGVLAYPAPVRAVPIVVGGMSPSALRRAGRNDGWFALQLVDDLDPQSLGDAIRSASADRGTEQPPLRVMLRAIGDPQDLAARLPELAAAGVTDVIVNVDWDDPEAARRTAERLRAGIGG